MNISQNIYIFADLILLSISALAADFMLFFEQVKETSEARNHNSLLQKIKHHIELRRNNNVASVFAEFSAYATLNILFDVLHAAHIPVFTLSANEKPRDIEKWHEVGFSCNLTKLFKVILFIETKQLLK
jgi:hypothetical protein